MNVIIILIALLIIFLVFTIKSNNRKKYSFDEAFIHIDPNSKPRHQYKIKKDETLDDVVEAIETKIHHESESIPEGIDVKIRQLIGGYSFDSRYLADDDLKNCLLGNSCRLDSREIKSGIVHYAIKQWIMYSHANTFDDFIMFIKNYLTDYKTKTGHVIIYDIEHFTRHILNF